MDQIECFTTGVHSPSALMRAKCLQVISNAIAAVTIASNPRDEVVAYLGLDSQVLDAVLTLYATGYNYETLPSYPVPYRLIEGEWVALLARAAMRELVQLSKGIKV